MATYQEQIEMHRKKREAREKAEAERKAAQLSPDQVSHWRLVLRNMGIPFAMSMPEEMVQQFKDGIQRRIIAELGSDAARDESTSSSQEPGK